MAKSEAMDCYNSVYSTFRQEIGNIIYKFPLINVPIRTPSLLSTTLEFATPEYMDSYAILRNYIVALKTFQEKNLILGRPRTCLTWISEEIKKGSLEFTEFDNFITNSMWKTENLTHLDYLVECFKKKTLTSGIFLEKCQDLLSIKPYDAPWSKNKIFIEDVMKDLNNCTSTLKNYLTEYFGNLKGETNETKYRGMCHIIHTGTIYLLNLYEKALIQAVYKQEYNNEHESLITAKGGYDQNQFGDAVLKSVATNRRELTEYRRKLKDVIVIELDPVSHEIKGMPTVDDLNTYIAFFGWEIK